MEKSRQVLGTTLTATEYNKVMQVEVKAVIFIARGRGVKGLGLKGLNFSYERSQAINYNYGN